MPDFAQQRDELGRWRRESEEMRQKLLLAREGVKRGRRRDAEVVRRLEGQARDLAARGTAIWDGFRGFIDPKTTLRQLDDRHPILLFPLRLETRFKTTAGTPQLWVRVYPDQCLLETFEPSLTLQEVENARRFWALMWAAGENEPDERAAWREIAASHGAGRAGWVIQHHAPTNPGDKPVPIGATEILLVVPATQAAPVQTTKFWTDVWRRGGDAAAIAAERPALEAVVGAATATEIIDHLKPVNLSAAPRPGTDRANAPLRVFFASFTADDDLEVRRHSWSTAPRVNLLPEQLVLQGYRGKQLVLEAAGNPIQTPLLAGPDPGATGDALLRSDGDQLNIPDDLAWMFDFERALAVGMAFRVDLTAEQAALGFERLIVLGVRTSASAAEGRSGLEGLLQNHLRSQAGLEILPQGTPTNNTEKGPSGFTVHGDASAGFDAFVQGEPLYAVEADALAKRDGQWLAESLGISHALVQTFPNSGGTDQSRGRAMNLALWPGTIGYMMRTMLRPVFDEETIAATRQFFSRHVLGCGGVPALRIGAQPYGILPVTAFDRINWLNPVVRNDLIFAPAFDAERAFLRKLYGILRRIEADWEPLVARVARLRSSGGAGADPHQTLLDVLALHPSSVEYYPLRADSLAHKFNQMLFLSNPLAQALVPTSTPEQAMVLLRSFGYAGAEVPDVANMLFSTAQPRLEGPVIDDAPLSETAPIAPCSGTKNYIEWLLDAARTNLETLQEERGFDAGKQPRALLYLMLRHAFQLSMQLTGAREQVKAGALTPAAAIAAVSKEPKFVHVASVAQASESRYALLHDRLVTAGNIRVADFISQNLGTVDPELTEQVAALEKLAPAPTAQLERAFAEHGDCASYRLDAWKQGLLHWQLERIRGEVGDEDGIFLGAFGWLENVKSEQKVLTPAGLDQETAALVDLPGDPPLVRDSTNLGFVHAPSLDHATTAAVLRNGYEAANRQGQLAVDLSSRRVRLALGILEGIRNGQSLSALLGYRFERHLHDFGPLTVRAFVFALRRKFPLAANKIQLSPGAADDAAAKEAIAAMNVVDGQKLLAFVDGSAVKNYPWGATDVPAATTPGHGTAIDAALAHVRDVNDAVADLVLAEGVHQAVSGNFDRAAGTLDAFSKGNYPPEPEVVETRRTGTTLVLRAAIHLDPAAAAPAGATPLALAEPAVNAWLAARMPLPANVGVSVKFIDRATNAPQTIVVTQANLGLQPIDLVYRLESTDAASLQFLDERIVDFVHRNHAPRLDEAIDVAYATRLTGGRVTFFELQALIRSLRTMVVSSRPLQASDLQRTNDSRTADQPAPSFPLARLVAARNDLNNVRVPALEAAIPGFAGGTIDAAIASFTAEVSKLGAYRLPQTGTGFAYEWRAATYEQLAKTLSDFLTVWTDRLAQATAALTDYDANPALPEEEKIARLQAIRLFVSTVILDPVPAGSVPYRAQTGADVTAFQTKLAALQAILATRHATLQAFLAAAQAEVPLLAPFDRKGLDVSAVVDEVARFREQLAAAATALVADAKARLAKVDEIIAPVPPVPLSLEKAQQAVALLFGDDFKVIPSFAPAAAAAADVGAALAHSTSGGLTQHLRDVVGREFPVDDWLHGIARVREKMAAFENAILLSEAFGASAPELTPLQLPHEANAAWLALEIPPPPPPPPGQAPTRLVDKDRLLYSAHFATPFAPNAPLCGLLVDEWTEVIPNAEETTGVAFHYDRPNSEPPQTWLLALPAVMDGAWSWDELVDAVHGALDDARRRAIEPAQVATTAYGWLLPATYSSYTFPEVSISNYLMKNIDLTATFVTLSQGG